MAVVRLALDGPMASSTRASVRVNFYCCCVLHVSVGDPELLTELVDPFLRHDPLAGELARLDVPLRVMDLATTGAGQETLDPEPAPHAGTMSATPRL